MDDSLKIRGRDWSVSQEEATSREIERVNARLRHFRGIAAGVMKDAVEIWRQIWELLQDQRSCEEILDGHGPAEGCPPPEDKSLLLEKLHLLGIYLEYARKLCDGSIGNESPEEEKR